MKTSDVKAHFGSQYAIASALGIKQPSVAAWGVYPPALRQLQLEAVTDGKLKAEPDCDKFRVKPTKREKVAA
jgi:DNA-binding transcriptional regulator YdaS (Cro superfamily)